MGVVCARGWFPRLSLARARTSPHLSRVYISRARVDDAHHLARDTTRGHIVSTHRARARAAAARRALRGRRGDRSIDRSGRGRVDSTTGRDRSMGRRDAGDFGSGVMDVDFFTSTIFCVCARLGSWGLRGGSGTVEGGRSWGFRRLCMKEGRRATTRSCGRRATSSLSVSVCLSVSRASMTITGARWVYCRPRPWLGVVDDTIER